MCPLCRIPRHLIRTKQRRHDRRNLRPVLRQPLPLQNPHWTARISRLLVLPRKESDLREIWQCERVDWWLLWVQEAGDRLMQIWKPYQANQRNGRSSKLFSVIFHLSLQQMRMDLGGIEARFRDFSCFWWRWKWWRGELGFFRSRSMGFGGEDDEISKNPRIWREGEEGRNMSENPGFLVKGEGSFQELSWLERILEMTGIKCWVLLDPQSWTWSKNS